MDVPLTIALILLGALILSLVLRWLVGRIVKRLSKLSGSTHVDRAQVAIGGQPQRLGQRLRTFQSVINSTIVAIVGTDRKSTRLNSSHVAISYAVFCLKKKTRT